MSDNPVKWTAAGLTPVGNALQAALLGTGDGLTFTRAVAADAEGVERLDLTLQSPCTVDGPKCRVPVLLTNAGVETAFTMTELRFYVRRVTDGAPTGEEILYATVTDEIGDPIPTAAQSPGFTIDWAFVFQYGNAGSVTVTLDPVGLVSIGMVGQPGGVAALGDNGAVPVSQGGTGATTAPAALAALGAGVRPSLVDNGIFVGAKLPINQRGETSWSTYGFHIDRWTFEQAVACSIQSDGLHVGSGQTIIQTVDTETKDFLMGKTITVSMLLSDGSFGFATGVISYDSNVNCNIILNDGYVSYSAVFYESHQSHQIGRITNSSPNEVSVIACKTELGDQQTLAYQDADGAWHLLPQPESDYAAQLLRCQQYRIVYKATNSRFPAFLNGNVGYATVQTPIQMAKKPVFQLLSPDYGVLYDATAVPNGASVTEMDANSVVIQLTFPSDAGVMSANWGQCWFALDTGM